MSAMLPYVRPLVQDIARNTAPVIAGIREDINDPTRTRANRIGAGNRGALALLPAIGQAVYQNTAAPVVRGVEGLVGVGGEVAAGLLGGDGTPAPAAPAAVAKPAVAPSIYDTNRTLTVRNTPQATALPVLAAPAVKAAPAVMPGDAITTGIKQQTDYAAQERGAILAQIAKYANMGSVDNRSRRAGQALSAVSSLAHLSGQNNFAALQGNAATSMATNAATIAAQQQAAETQAENIRKQVIPVDIGSEVNPDPATRPFAPMIPKKGFITKNDKGDITVSDIYGKPVTAPGPLPSHVDALRADPKLAASFDQKYGEGAAKKILGK